MDFFVVVVEGGLLGGWVSECKLGGGLGGLGLGLLGEGRGLEVGF